MQPLETRTLDPNLDWAFFDSALPEVTDEYRARILPLTASSARGAWELYVSDDRRARHPMLLPANHWLGQKDFGGPDWVMTWNLADLPSPDPIATFLTEHIQWAHDARLLFFWARESCMLTRWDDFKTTWRAFLLADDEGPFLLHPESAQVVWFGPNGQLRVCLRPC